MSDMTTVSLVDIMGTRYLANFLDYDLTKALEKLADGTTVDVSKVKFGPASFTAVMQHMNRLNFINSEDSELDSILQSMQRDTRAKLTPNMKLPVVLNWDDLLTYVKEFPLDKEYYMWDITVDRNAVFAIIAVILSYPQLRFDISNMYYQIFSLLEGLGAPTEPSPVHVSSIRPTVLTTEIKAGAYATVSAQFLCSPAIDLENPGKHLFAKVIYKMREKLDKPPYDSFVFVAREQFNF